MPKQYEVSINLPSNTAATIQSVINPIESNRKRKWEINNKPTPFIPKKARNN